MGDTGDAIRNRAVDGAPTGMVALSSWSGLQAAMEGNAGDAIRYRAVDGAPTGAVPLSGRSGLQAAMEL